MTVRPHFSVPLFRPDPAGLLAAKPGNPQSWNLYTYSMNSPLTNIDPDGLDCVSATNNRGGYSIDHNSDSGASAACGKAGGTWVPGYVDENWVHYNGNNGQYQVGSVDGAATVDYATFKAGAQTDANGNCTSGCGGYGFASANEDWLKGQLVGNSNSGGLDGYIHFLVGREQQLSAFSQIAYGPLIPLRTIGLGRADLGLRVVRVIGGHRFMITTSTPIGSR